MAKQTNALPSHSNPPLLCNYLAGAQIIVTDCGMELRTRAREEQKLLKLALPLEKLQWNILRAIVANVCWSEAYSFFRRPERVYTLKTLPVFPPPPSHTEIKLFHLQPN